MREPTQAPRTLTVFCEAGLGNRLRVLLSGMALAEASGREFTMLWPRNPACGAAFRELFVSSWPVTDVDQLDPALRAAYIPTYSVRTFSDLLVAPEAHVVRGSNVWLIFPDRFPGHRTLAVRCGELIGALMPRAGVAERVAAFRARQFRPLMIGVHARRGDYVRHRPDLAGNTARLLAAVDGLLDGMPEAGILLCTDDGALDRRGRPTRREGVGEIFRSRYGDRLVETVPHSLDRRSAEAIEEALVDLLLLRATHAFVGTSGSSFSEIAVLGRAVPEVRVGEATRAHRWVHRIARVTGVHWLARRIVAEAHGVDVPYVRAGRIIRLALARRLTRLTGIGRDPRGAP